MIITRTPFRFTLGGGGTDLPSYYSQFGGLIFAAAIDKYMFLSVNRPIVDDWVRVKYSRSEIVDSVADLKHDLARVALEEVGISKAIEIISMADVPAGTGLGSSGSYLVGLLNALHTLKRDPRSSVQLAEMACTLEMERLKRPVGKQDPYLAAVGGFPVMEIDKEGRVSLRQARLDKATIDDLNHNTLIFFTGTTRLAEDILRHQDNAVRKQDASVVDSLHRIKEIGYQVLEAVESGDLDRFGLLMDEHWQAKTKLSPQIADSRHHEIYQVAKKEGALGGKLIGAGGGGFFVFYANQRHRELRQAMLREGLRELSYRFDSEGSKVMVNLAEGRGHA